jgi:hypothetical protein
MDGEKKFKDLRRESIRQGFCHLLKNLDFLGVARQSNRQKSGNSEKAGRATAEYHS